MCIEIIARYHILNTHIMIGANGEYLELEQLDKSLTTLAEHYSDGLKPDADGNQKIFPNEDEFRAYTILRHPRDSYIERQDYTRNWPEHVRNSKKVQHAFNLREAMNDHAFPSPYGFEARQYFSTFFELVKSKDTDMFTLCLLQLHFGEIRKHALKMLTDTYMKTSRNTTVDFIKEYLCYESVDIAIDEMTSYGLSIKEYTSDDGQSYRYLEPLTGQLNCKTCIYTAYRISHLTILQQAKKSLAPTPTRLCSDQNWPWHKSPSCTP